MYLIVDQMTHFLSVLRPHCVHLSMLNTDRMGPASVPDPDSKYTTTLPL